MPLFLHLKVIEEPSEPSKFREIGICTEKWVEVIKASKQTDTEDFAFKVRNQQIKVNKQLKCIQNFAFKDTESPRVADMVFEPSPERVVMERRSSLRRNTSLGSPAASRRSSVNSPVPSRKVSSTPKAVATRTQGTMTLAEMKVKAATRDARTDPMPQPKPTSLPLASKNSPAREEQPRKSRDAIQ